MKYLSSLLPVFLLAACNQSAEPTPYQAFLNTQPDTISSAANAVMKMNEQASRDAYEAKVRRDIEKNTWRYDLPMPGSTYINTRSASLKANHGNVYLKLVKGKDINMIALLSEDARFAEKSMLQNIKVQFDTAEAKVYTCSVDPVFGFLVIEPREAFLQNIKSSHRITIKAVTKENVQRKEYRYRDGGVASEYSYRRSRGINRPVEIKKTVTINNNETWIFNSGGLNWK